MYERPPGDIASQQQHRAQRYGYLSSLLAVLTLLIWLASAVFFESAFIGMSSFTERLIFLVALVLPAIIGAVLGGLGLQAQRGRGWAVAGCIVNVCVALFFSAVLLIAG